jgi:hypothetical protein
MGGFGAEANIKTRTYPLLAKCIQARSMIDRSADEI